MATQNFEKFSSLSFYGERSETGESTKHECQMDTPVKPEYDKRMECGRSMVEMLGTLAIIGVLSIGGIAGYSYGMDKYRANETINDVMLMGVDIITQLSQNRGTPTLSADWGTKTTAGYDFTVVPNPEDETQYGIQITGVPSSVCKIVGDALKQTVDVYVGNEDYDSDTKEDPCDESDNNTMEFYFDTGAVESDGCKTDAECGENKYCDFGLCFDGFRPEMTGHILDTKCTSDSDCNEGWTGNCSRCDTSLGRCVENWDMYNKACSLSSGKTGKCGGGKCLSVGCTYDTNKCEAKSYCAIPDRWSDVKCQAFQEGETGACISFNERFSSVKINGETYYLSNTQISWWDADAACKSVNKRLLNVEELVTETDGGKWNGDTGSHIKTVLFEQLREKGWDSMWEAHIFTANQIDASCEVYVVNLYGNVGTRKRYSYTDRSYAICK